MRQRTDTECSLPHTFIHAGHNCPVVMYIMKNKIFKCKYISSPFIIEITGYTGKLVSLRDTLSRCEQFLHDELIDYPDNPLYMIGPIDEAKMRISTTTVNLRLPMNHILMSLKVLLPSQVFIEQDGVSSIVAETTNGSFGLHAHRLDCITNLSAGILTYETEAVGPVYIAIDAGMLIKKAEKIVIFVSRAIGGADLNQLRSVMEQEFPTHDDKEQHVREAMDKLETGFLSQLAKFQHE